MSQETEPDKLRQMVNELPLTEEQLLEDQEYVVQGLRNIQEKRLEFTKKELDYNIHKPLSINY